MSEIKRYTASIPPLHTIKDPDTRRVLEALVSGWRTRNGETRPDSDERFVTKGEIQSVVETVNQSYFSAGGLGYSIVAGDLTPRINVGSLVDAAKQSVLSSRLFAELGDRVQRIDASYTAGLSATAAAVTRESEARANADNAITREVETQISKVNQSIAGVQTTTGTLANNVSSLAYQVTTLQADVGNQSAALQVETNARVNADLSIEGKYTVKVDLNGYVTGFGLLATSNNGVPSSSFIVRADKFAVASPTGPGIQPLVPFVVQTVQQTLPDGSVLPPGVYMDTAVVKQLYGTYIQAGVLDAGRIYTGSRFTDRDSGLQLLSAAVGAWSPGSIDPPVREVIWVPDDNSSTTSDD